MRRNSKYSKLSDEKLMELIEKFDKKAFTEIYERYSARMLNYFHKMMNYNRPKAEDLMQQLFIKILEKPGMFDPERKFSSWIFTVASNLCKNEYKKSEIERKYIENTDHDIISKAFDTNLDNEMFRIYLVEELKRMDFEHKTVFILRYREELSIKEIAEITGSKIGTVKSRLFYTLKKLNRKLKIFDPKLN